MPSSGRPPPTHDPAGDAALVRAALAREPRAVDEFVRRMVCVPRILAHLNRRLATRLDDDDLRDLSQSTLLVVWQKLPGFRYESSLETWAYRIARFELMSATRRARHMRTLDEAADLVDPTMTDRDFERRFDYEVVAGLLDTLDAEQATVIRLKHFEPMTFIEIGEHIGAAPETVKSRYYRGIRSIRRSLGMDFREDRA